MLGSEVIKTYPRMGYQWTAALTPIPTKKSLALTERNPKKWLCLWFVHWH